LPPEAALVEAVRGGDREAFSGLYGMFAPMVHGILLARVPYGEVGDLVQDVFLVAFKKLGSLRDRERFGPWVAMIARNRAVDFHRRARVTEARVCPVADALEDPSALGRRAGIHDLVVSGNRGAGELAVLLGQAGAALDIGEQEGEMPHGVIG
jgi:RNA polymerase sigma factor (sigma-70 family)